MSTCSFPKRERLSARSRIELVFKKGRRYSGEGISLFVLPNDLGHNRFLCTFRRGFGNAVRRNRVRRVFKEIYRQHKTCFKTSFDIVVLLSKGFLSAEGSFAMQFVQFFGMLRRAGLNLNDGTLLWTSK